MDRRFRAPFQAKNIQRLKEVRRKVENTEQGMVKIFPGTVAVRLIGREELLLRRALEEEIAIPQLTRIHPGYVRTEVARGAD